MSKKSVGEGALGKTIRWLEVFFHLAVFILYGLAMLSSSISPARTQVPAFLNMAFPVVLFGMVVVCITCLIFRRWRYFLLYALLMLLTSGYILTCFPLNFGKNLRENRDLRVMTYNVESFRKFDEEAKSPKAISLILDHDADVVGLQEGMGSYLGLTGERMIRRVFGKKYPYIFCSEEKGQVLLSKFPILYTEQIKYPSYRNGSFFFLLELPSGATLMVVNNHMESYSLHSSEKKKYKDYVTDVSVAELPRQLLEIKHRLGPNLNARAFAAERVEREIRRLREKYEPSFLVVMGDLNDTPKSYTYRRLRSDLRDAYAETGFGFSPTYNEPPFRFRIDHLFYGGNMDAIGSKIPSRRDASDHNPLVVDFRIKM